MSQSVQQRTSEILKQIDRRGHVSVRDLASEMLVSEATIRRDLRALADRRQVELVYGGATAPRQPDHSLQARSQRNVEAKRAIGRAAAELVQEGELVFVDSGTTCFEMRHGLASCPNLSVITNSAKLASDLGERSNLGVIFLGGHYRPGLEDTIGPLTLNAIDQLRGYTAFIGADGLSADFGVSATDIETAYLYQHVVKNARETILLADHTKFAAPSLYRICGLEAVARIVTDCPPEPGWHDLLASLGIDLVVPAPEGPA